ncbi:SRPBCC domain-containing protein [Planomonospora venezuelensis]|uniref:SRPBCC domain-containing protein n=1 Tax=Planomonospora venezuelensis TaxID=1999 RepID=A0A841DC11_PLAVE|nr:SRPBCC domain-containing protein [Planomonospora venezuelensis]MBB5965828.1 hypothetical protein [Planomonospora venezuelensis]GIN04022.1 hypothetical protein Pve01_56800 [Planomonospora venezuelensis]
MRQLISTTDIAAPPEHVWGVLTDFSRYSEWNPMFTGAAGDLVPGGVLALRMPVTEGGRSMTSRTRVLEAEPGRRLSWRWRVVGSAVLQAVHEFDLRPAGGGTTLVQRETMVGALVPLLSPVIATYEKTFVRLSEALKARSEGEAGRGA